MISEYILGLILFLPFLTVTSTDFPKASENFAKEYYRVISKTDENVICSPLSIEIGLAMISVGAGGPTKWALLNLFGTKVYPEEASYHQNFLSDLNSCDSRTRLDLANKIFVSDRYQLKPEFINIMKYGYRSEPQEMNFANAEETANLINQWVEDKTNKKIADLVQPNSINSDTGMILVNAAYFLGTWEKPFREDLTRKEEFYLLNGDEITCDMMHKKARYGSLYDRKLKAVVLEMKYADKDTRMLFFLPDEDSSLEYLKENINQFDFQNYSMTFMETDVVIPKFKISSMFDLKDKLSEMGLEDLFNENSMLPNIVQNRNLKIGEIKQKVFIEVNEKGTEAAAATSVHFEFLSLDPEFTLNRPFLFALLRKDKILFLGHITKPC